MLGGLGITNQTIGQCEITHGVVRWIVNQDQMCQASQGLAQCTQVVIAPDVAIDQYKRLIAQQRQGLEDPTTGFQGLALG
ncbi:hypothetical protein D9M73_185840 [compost metagenome]